MHMSAHSFAASRDWGDLTVRRVLEAPMAHCTVCKGNESSPPKSPCVPPMDGIRAAPTVAINIIPLGCPTHGVVRCMLGSEQSHSVRAELAGPAHTADFKRLHHCAVCNLQT